MAEPRPMSHDMAAPLGAHGGKRSLATSIAAVGAALLASLCCIGPVLFVSGPELKAMMPAHRARVTRLTQMHREMMREMIL